MQSKEVHYSKWFRIAIVNLLLASLLGVTLRLAFLVEIPGLSFKNILHGHSHVAMIGWGYLAVFALLMQFFGREFMHQQVFRLLYYGNQIAVVGMFLTFPFFGYTGIPLFFTTVHLLLAYIFTFYFLRQLSEKGFAALFVKSALIFHIISTLAIWVLPVLIVNDLRHSAAYHMAVQFFLHFQFNGWFIFAVIGIFFKIIEPQLVKIKKSNLSFFLYFLLLATFLTYAMAVTWSEPLPFIFLINSTGVLMQFIALLYFIIILRQISAFSHLDLAVAFFRFALLCFILKIAIQTLVIIPYFAVVAYTIRNFVVGFIHLILLGMITGFILAVAIEIRWLNVNLARIRWGLILFLLGFLSTEVLLFYQGILLWAEQGFLPQYYVVILLLSLFFPVGLGLLCTNKPTTTVVT
ncbi:MAG: hypothetical protein HKN76_08285 [Saprospiraceae bacterium]|nr:hypothetical protein [Saprospiraceae bacterium]